VVGAHHAASAAHIRRHIGIPPGEILRKIDGPVAADTPADEIEDCDDAEDEYDPAESAEADEDCWTQSARRA
jgi:hypothetical protein